VRTQRKEENRASLMRAALEIVIEQGLPELTTSSVSARVGLAQPTFYAYFDNIDHLLTASITEAINEFRSVMRKAMDHVRPEVVMKGDLLEARSLLYRDNLNALLADRVVAELVLRYRRDPTTIVGRTVGAALSEIRAELASTLQRFARKLGSPPQVLQRVSFSAEIMMANTLAVAETLLDGRINDTDEAARLLAVMNANWLSFLFKDKEFKALAGD
jgi:AcrR family transcriptional regulator